MNTTERALMHGLFPLHHNTDKAIDCEYDGELVAEIPNHPSPEVLQSLEDA